MRIRASCLVTALSPGVLGLLAFTWQGPVCRAPVVCVCRALVVVVLQWLKPQGPPFSSCALCEAALHSPAQPSDGATAAFQTQTIHGLQPCCSRSVFRAVFSDHSHSPL
ncbi:hypothetical protein INR49_019045 [Caranx melampygus]|nr:hypothetical protein INR49_019045 [Caranx melampygus]